MRGKDEARFFDIWNLIMSIETIHKAKTILIALLIGVLPIIGSCSNREKEGDLIKELREVKEKDHHTAIDITDVVKKHIPIGMKKVDALEILKKNEFQVSDLKERRFPVTEFERVFSASFEMSRNPSQYAYTEARINIYINEEKVKKVWGSIFYHSL